MNFLQFSFFLGCVIEPEGMEQDQPQNLQTAEQNEEHLEPTVPILRHEELVEQKLQDRGKGEGDEEERVEGCPILFSHHADQLGRHQSIEGSIGEISQHNYDQVQPANGHEVAAGATDEERPTHQGEDGPE